MVSMNEVMKIVQSYCDIVERGLNERWGKLPVEIYDSETYETIGGLMARQATLSIELARSPSIWTGHVAPLILRSMTDTHITLAWILCDPSERAKKYILYGLGQEKLHIEHLKAGAEQDDEQVQKLIEMKESWLNSQRRDFMTEVNVGNWAGLNTRQMAQESGCEGLYKFAYTPFSGVAHNMWQHVSIYNLKPCSNPMHKYHKVPTILEAPMDPDYVYRSAKYVDRTYEAIDEKYNLEIEAKMPLEYFVEEFDRLHANESRT
jgi:hypothetical protein